MLNQKIKNRTVIDPAKTPTAALLDNVNGKIGIPILLYFLGVPGIVALLLWVLFFRG